MNTPIFRTSQAPLSWQWPVDLATYDQTPSLSDQEKEAITYAVTHLGSRSAKARAALLRRLVQPLTDVLVAIGSPQQEQYAPILVLLDEMNRRGTTYWAWSADEWVETIGPTRTAFQQRHHRSGPKARQQVLVIAYLLTGFTNFFSFASKTLQLHQTASTIFGPAQIDAATQRIRDVLTQRGYSPPTVEVKVQLAIAVVFLLNRSPSLERVTYHQLASLRDQASSALLSDGLGLLSLALTDLHLLEAALPRRRLTKPIVSRMEAEGVPREWARWCIAWYERSPLSVNTKGTYLCHLRKVGLWLAKHHPGITSPEQWDDDLGFAFVSAVNEMNVGDYVNMRDAIQGAGIIGKALMPRSKDNVLTVMRRFFSDLQEVPHSVDDRGAHRILRCFNPLLVFETPRSIGRLIGPDPRVIDDAWWWKMLGAATALGEEDLPRSKNGYSLYPLAMVQALAVTWCYSGLRSDELKRLRVGCIRWQWEQDMLSEAGERTPEDATCFLHVPVNKTGTAFWKPVYALVGTYINAWEKERPPQPRSLDRKTNELVDFLFSYRRGRIGDGYLNNVVIPLLCEKAGVPGSDARGRITSHRARATIATLYYNCPDGLTGPEIQAFLGHADFRSTRSYIKATPTKLAKSVARANKNSRLVKVLVDPQAAVQGEPAIFYDLGDGTFCGNPAWASCPHRMACIKCPMHIGVELAQLIRARDGIMSLLQEVPDLSEEEKAVAEGDRDTLNKLIEKYKDVAPPPIPNERYIFNPTALPSSRGKMLPVIPLSKESSSSTETKHVVEVNRSVAARLPQPLVSQ